MQAHSFKLKLALMVASLALTAPTLVAQLSIPSDGSDGALIISNNTTINLSQAIAGNWADNNTANAGKGIYDSNKWAVVFKYSSVVISNGATLTFLNHPTHAPVVWLVSNNVVINGTISLDGQPSPNGDLNLAEPGPGGFRGGNSAGAGFGPGGGFSTFTFSIGYYSTTHPYGNLQIVPLIGGSGGYTYSGSGGGGGGGALMIAASGTITISSTGSCHANGGTAFRADGSGGAIRLIASQILGNGTIQATGGDAGRIRLESTNTAILSVSPFTTTVSPFPLTIWPPASAATVQVISVSNLASGLLLAPLDPRSAMTTSGDDMTIVTTNTVVIQVRTTNFPTNGTVNVYIKPRETPQTILSANAPISGDTNSAIWQVTATLPYPNQHTVIQARALY